MRLKTKLLLFTNITVFISVSVITYYAIFDIRKNAERSIREYEHEEMDKVKQHLKDIVNISYEMISVSYRNAQNMELIEKLYGHKLEGTSNEIKDLIFENVKENILFMTLEDIRVLRHNIDGYIFITDNTPPYRVVMNPLKPELEGTSVGDDPAYNLVKDTKQNIYEAFAELCEKQGEGFLEYDYYKPGIKGMAPKLSYIKLFKPKNWIIGTGVYIDNIEEMVEQKHHATQEQVKQLMWVVILIASALILFSSVLLYKLGDNITTAIYRISNQLNALALGKAAQKTQMNRTDEIGEMNKSVDKLIDGITAYTIFAIEIGKGNYKAHFKALSEGDNLGNSLLEMRRSLQEAETEEKKRKEEDEKQNWATRGIAKFSDIMRKSSDSIEELAYKIISNLIEYVEADIGGIYIFNDEVTEDKHLELIASYAFDRRKFMSKKIRPGEGLVGTCAIEKKTIHLQKLPENYIQISSGLGNSRPSTLLIVPLIVDEALMGVIELASFQLFEPYEVTFVEKVGESIAATLASAKMTDRTSRLLSESREQSEMLAAQEEEMRQNIEELQATQDRVAEIQEDKEQEIEQLRQNIKQLENVNAELENRITLLLESKLTSSEED